jgi:FAD binding domain/Berberine and berberine like
MQTATVATSSEAPTTASELDSLRRRLTGKLITDESADYAEARLVHDITVDRLPLAIARAANAQDVAETVRFARQHNLPLAVRSGGHSVPLLSMIEGAVVADLSAMKGITIDPERRTARVQAGATSGDLAGPAHAYGLALSTGDTSTVGFGGLTTGGGVGFMARKYGLAIDNLLSAEVVTASGEIVTASTNENPDLFWAIRGGGGNFGIITEFEFRLAPVGQVLGGDLLLPASREVIRGYLDYMATAPDELTTLGNLMHAPPFPWVPENRVGEVVLSIIVCWTGSVEDGERALAPLRALATPVADTVRPIPYPVIYESTAHQAAPHAATVRMTYADDFSDEAIDTMLAAIENASSPFSVVHLRGMGGAFARIGNDETAFANRDKRYFFAAIAVWLDAAEDGAPHRAWAESLFEKVRHEGSGAYVNFLDNEGEDRIREAYGANYARLAEIKAKYDPTNLFRFNQNIRPAG